MSPSSSSSFLSSSSFSSSCAKASMEIEAWFKIVDPQTSWDRVSLEGIEYMAYLKRAIKIMEPALNSYGPALFTIKATYNDDQDPQNAIELDPETKLNTVLQQVLRLPLRFVPSSSFHLHLVSETSCSCRYSPPSLGITHTNTKFLPCPPYHNHVLC